jgi:hypothetical protein
MRRRAGRERSREEGEGGRGGVRWRRMKGGRGSEEEEGGREAVRRRMERKGEKGSEENDCFKNFPRQCLQWFLKIDQSECSKSPIDLHRSNNTCVVPDSEHPQS